MNEMIESDWQELDYYSEVAGSTTLRNALKKLLYRHHNRIDWAAGRFFGLEEGQAMFFAMRDERDALRNLISKFYEQSLELKRYEQNQETTIPKKS